MLLDWTIHGRCRRVQSSNKGQDVEIADEDTKIEVEEITGEKINKVKSEEKKEE